MADAQRGELCQLALMPSGRRGRVPRGTTLLEAARQLGVEIESICGGRQTCGKCQIVVEEGHFAKHGLTSAADHLAPVAEREAEYIAEHGLGGRRLACAAEVAGDLLINVPEESQARKQVIAKAATDRVIEVRPAVRQVYVELAGATLTSHGGDWERIKLALAEQWQLGEVGIDPVMLPSLQPALGDEKAQLGDGRSGATLTLWHDREVLRVQPGYAEGVYGLAVDVGSTTVVMHLCDLRTGQLLATEATMNPQVRYGEDLMSRVSYGMREPQGVARLHRAIITALNDLARRATAPAGLALEDVFELVLVGNTVMHHLLLGIDPVSLGGSPFALAVSGPVDVKARDLGIKLHPAARVHVLPCIAGHVGADNVAVQLAEAPHRQDEMMLVVDVGTNAEIVLGNRERVVCASSPTGPAFEGAQITHGQRAAPGAIERVRIDPSTLEPRFRVIGHESWLGPGQAPPEGLRATGICGSGIIEAVVEMYTSGIIRHEGRFDENAPARSPRVRFNGRQAEYVLATADQTATGAPIVVTQNDVRAIQLAKGALYAGVKLLLDHLGLAVSDIDRIVMAGAFGSYIDPRHAMILGMIPDCDLSRVEAVGNAAGDGARIALLDRTQRQEAARLAQWVEHVQTAVAANFQAEFVSAMALPHATDPFPHLEGQLPPRAEGRGARGSQRRRPMQAERNQHE